ncbi:putative membrane protein [Propionispora sp. 2/2-37]|uniref:GlsB/YeaQ/YmgE family stress response membrane protein n=1 Tax=Propionispora sp. 2/2-37 TaxID=1677858 RepID=UPI0006BB9986|nr:GlsB/YeaQ/YmgE family stress response membrane protein [Propionispora sp. 2/2-37]CUH96669.1 putative membrane protein [Propionispora sp. 2/2-37]
MLWFLLIGIISGWLAGKISRGGGFGIWGDLITGVIGSYIGGFLFNLMGFTAYSTIGAIIASTIGAIVFLWVIRLFRPVASAAQKKD